MNKIQLPVIITPSRTELGLRCYRRHVLGDILQRALYYSPSLEFGSVIHAAAAAWWKAALDNADTSVGAAAARTAIATEWQRRFERRPINVGDLSEALAQSMAQKYVATATLAGPFELEAGEWQIVSVEDRLEVPLLTRRGQARLSFQTDRVVYNKTTQHLVIIDTKTASRFDKRWERQWDTSLQMKLYKAAAARAYDMPIERIDVVIEGVLKAATGAIVKYVPCPEWSADVLGEAVRQAQYIAERDWDLLESDVPNVARDEHLVVEDAVNKTALNYMSCFEYGVECPFRRLCLAEPSERVALLRSEYIEVPEEDQGY